MKVFNISNIPLLSVFFLVFISQHRSHSSVLVPEEEIGCGRLPPGENVNAPWIAAVFLRNSSSLKTPYTSYAGILLSPSLVFVGAGMFLEKLTYQLHTYRPEDYLVSLGRTAFSDPELDGDESAITSGITHIRIHPYFKAGFWAESENRFVLLHLSSEIQLSERIQPPCIPDSRNVSLIAQLNLPNSNDSKEEILLTGWAKRDGVSKYSSLNLKIQSQEKCQILWDTAGQTNGFVFPYPYVGRWCALTGESNPSNDSAKRCINYDVGATREMDGKHYFAGLVNNHYSLNLTGYCPPGRPHFFENLDQKTFKWIENNVRCGPDKFTCSNGDCIDLSKVCDRRNDCLDSSDEEPSYCGSICPEDSFPCGIETCIPNDQGEESCKPEDSLKGKMKAVVASFITVGVGLSLIACGIYFIYRRKWMKVVDEMRDLTRVEAGMFFNGKNPPKSEENDENPQSENDPILSMRWDPAKEIPKKKIQIGHELDRGNFGIVYYACLYSNGKKFNCEAAVKKCIPSIRVTEFKALLDEIKIMASLESHPHVVGFFGACTRNIRKRDVWLVMEYCAKGNLKQYLLNNRSSFVLTTSNVDHSNIPFSHSTNLFDTTLLLKWAIQACSGLQFLAKKNIIHRDIAARNFLVTGYKRVKVGDFGRSRILDGTDIYAATSKKAPLKWLAPELFEPNPCYSEKTDVWAFGITLWEIFSFGAEPYEGRDIDPWFPQSLLQGMQLEKPEISPLSIYDLMQKCWNLDTNQRPTFARIKDALLQSLREYVSNEETTISSVVEIYFEIDEFAHLK